MTESPQNPRETPPGPRERRGSQAVAALAVIAALVSLLSTTSWARHRSELLSVLSDAGIEDADLIRRLERETTPHHAQLAAARSLIYKTLSVQHDGDAEERRILVSQLPQAEDLARGVLESQPNSWQATMLLGTSVYLRWSLDRDTRLYTESSRWERPLQKAVADAAGHPEPKRILATAYLEVWHALSPAKREDAKALIARVFSDDLRAFEALSPIWFDLGGMSLDESLEVVPQAPEAWAQVERAFAQAKRWQPYITAHRNRLDALEAKLEKQRDEGEKRLRLGAFVDSRSRLLRVVHQSPPSARFLPLVTSALELYPPGLHGLASTTHLEPWVDWSLELSRLGLDGLPADAMGLLLDAIVDDDFPPSKAALMALRADELYQAERHERLAQPLTLYVWAPYLIAKAERLVEEGRPEEARDTLSEVALAARSELPYLLAARRTAAAVGDLGWEDELLAKIDKARRSDFWRGSAWRTRRNRVSLELFSARPAEGLEIEIRKAPAQGAVVELSWDGATLAQRTARAGQRLRLAIDVGTDPHLLEMRSLAGGHVTPGEVHLLGPAAAPANDRRR